MVWNGDKEYKAQARRRTQETGKQSHANIVRQSKTHGYATTLIEASGCEARGRGTQRDLHFRDSYYFRRNLNQDDIAALKRRSASPNRFSPPRPPAPSR